MKKSLSEWLRTVSSIIGQFVLLPVGIVGIGIGVWDLVGTPPDWLKKIPEASLVVLGVIAAYLSFERPWIFIALNKSINDLSDSVNLEEARLIQSLPEGERKSVKNLISKYAELSLLKTKVENNEAFFIISDKIFKEQSKMIEKLSEGQLEYSEEQIPVAHGMLANALKHRLDAVSYDDIDFWLKGLKGYQGPEEKYLKLNVQAFKRGCVVTRIFILKVDDLINRVDDITKVLMSQQVAGIGWGIAVQELMNDHELGLLTEDKTSTDFALFDGGMAVSYFRKFMGRRFEAILYTYPDHINASIIEAQKRIHKFLIAESWIINRRFKDIYFQTGMGPASPSSSAEKYLTKPEIENIRMRAVNYNDQLKGWLSKDAELKGHFMKNGEFGFEDEVFVLVVENNKDNEDENLNEIRGKIELLGKIAKKNFDRMRQNK